LTRIFSMTDGTRLAVLDDRFEAAARRWPTIFRALCLQVEDQMERIAVQQLISQLPRAEQRIVALLWHLADRWGRTEPQGMVVPLTVGHEAISRLVGGRRSTVSAALGRLADQDLVTRLSNGTWLLAPASRELLDHSALPGPTPGIQLLGTRRRFARAPARL
jgi:CRP-like cAMP-binding protein